jgi:hypothetical protein
MGSFEWMELQTLTGDINASRSRLAQARSSKDHRLIRVLETEIATAEGRRDRLLSDISTHLAGTPDAAAEAAAASIAAAPVPDGESPPESPPEAVAEPMPAEAVEVPAASVPAPPPVAVEDRSVEGDIVMWEQVTPGDIERAQSQIGVRRVEMLARHSEELKALEAEQGELETLEQAVRAFVQRFKPDAAAAAASAVVKLGEERELRAQGRG